MKSLPCPLGTDCLMEKGPSCGHVQPGSLGGPKSNGSSLTSPPLALATIITFTVMRSQKMLSWGRI